MRRVPFIAYVAGLCFAAAVAPAAPSSMMQSLSQACEDKPQAEDQGPFSWATKWFRAEPTPPQPTAVATAMAAQARPAPPVAAHYGDWRSAPSPAGAAPLRQTNPLMGAATFAPLPPAPSLAPAATGFTIDEQLIAAAAPPVVEPDPTEPKALRDLGHARDREGDLVEAERLYRKAIGADPTNPAALNDLGLCLARQGKLEPAAAMLRQAITMRPDKPLYRNNIATVLVELGRPSEALAHLKTAYRPAAAHHNLGLLLVRSGAAADAATHLRQALELDPSFQQSRDALARLENGADYADSAAATPAGGQTDREPAPPAGAPSGFASAPQRRPAQVAAAPRWAGEPTYEPTPAGAEPPASTDSLGSLPYTPAETAGVSGPPRLLPPVLDR
ncbi:tetratricopeptide repeat protein [Botrimarina sp.]|uniref:tetratricopeptide repeat protein n=1 Tax=Botrimarina sp. TaxID=2795802 RepID=UPI0032EE2745